MAKKKVTKKKIKTAYKVLCAVIALIIAVVGYFFLKPETQDPPELTEGELQVHIIDVGQADAILVLSEDKVMLVDTGDLDDGYTEKIINYIKSFNIDAIDYLVLTHPDSDHIGGAPEIFAEFEIKNCIMPDFAKTTKIYENTLDAIEAEEGLNLIEAVPDYDFKVGEAKCRILAPIEKYSDANEASVVIRLVFGERSVLLTGDAEKESEADMVKRYSASELKADVLKSGHHGSSTSSSEALLDKVDPDYAIISCGEGNKYGHPHDETIERYEEYEIEVYRTDEDGTVIVKIKDNKITITKEK